MFPPAACLLARYALDVVLEYERRGPSWRAQDTITVRFVQEFDERFQRTLHARVLAAGRSARDRRLEWTVTPPEKLPSLVRSSVAHAEVPTNTAEAQKLLLELYHDGQDRVISASFARFAAVLGSVPGGLDIAYMSEINLGLNNLPFDETRVRKGIEALEEAMGRRKMHPASLRYCQGNAWLALREYETARDVYTTALAEMDDPRLADLAAQCCKNLGTTLEQLGEHVGAVQLYKRALQLNPDLAEAHFALALQYLRTGENLPLALTHLDAVTYRHGSAVTAPPIQGWRVEILFRMGDTAGAYRELNTLLTAANQFDWIWRSCARQVAKYGRASTDSTAKALAFWRVYLRNHPADVAAQRQHFLCLSVLHWDKRPTDSNFEEFKSAAARLIDQRDPDPAFLWDRVGHWAQSEGDWNNAEQAFRKAYELEPERYGYCLGTALNFLDRHAEALPILLEQAEKHMPDAMSWFQVAVAREAVGDIPATIAAYQRALELDPQYDLAWFNLGGIYWKSRDVEQARATWTEAISKFPEHWLAIKVQRELPFLFGKTD